MSRDLDRREFFCNDARNIRATLFQLLHNEWNTGSNLSNRWFFQKLAADCRGVFGAQCVNVWEPTTSEIFQLLASTEIEPNGSPPRELIPRHATNAQHAIVSDEAITSVLNGEKSSVELGDATPSDWAITSIPVSISQDDREPCFIVNLHFDQVHKPSSRVDSAEAVSIRGCMQSSFVAFRNNQSRLIHEALQLTRLESLSASSVLSLVRPYLENTTGAVGLSLLTKRHDDVEFEFAMGAIPSRTFNSHSTTVGSWLDDRCKGCSPTSDERNRLLAWLEDVNAGNLESSIFSHSKHRSFAESRGVRFFDEMITQIATDDKRTLGFLWCYADPKPSGLACNFCTLDLQTLQLVADAIAPQLRHLLEIRSRTPLLRVIEAATIATSSRPLAESLNTIIHDIVASLNTSIGSIYLYDSQQQLLTMNAAAGWNESLVGNASYRLGEGLTGTIANDREVRRFDSHEEMSRDPAFSGKHDHLIWKGTGTKCETFLGVPIVFDDELLGVLKLGNVLPSATHPDNRFTEEDVQTARAIAAMLALMLQDAKRQEVNALWENAISQTALAMLNESSEEVVLEIAKKTLESTGISCMLSLVDPKNGDIVGCFATGNRWPKILKETRRSGNGSDILAICLNSNKAEFIPNVASDLRCNAEAARLAEIEAFYVLPLRVGEEKIGTLQLDLPPRFESKAEYTNVVHALASCIAYAVSRVRAQETSLRLATDTLSCGRAVATDLTMATAAHNLGHQIDEVIRALEVQFQSLPSGIPREVRRIIAGTVGELRRIEDDLRRYEAPNIFWEMENVDVTQEVGRLLRDYQILFRSRKCVMRLASSDSIIYNRLPVSVFREILRELLTNAADAGASTIEVSIDAIDRYPVEEDFEAPVVCVDVNDDGSGMQDSVFHSAFEPKVSSKTNGNGMGLFFCRRFAKGFGGDMEVYRNFVDGFATTVRIVLPVRK